MRLRVGGLTLTLATPRRSPALEPTAVERAFTADRGADIDIEVREGQVPDAKPGTSLFDSGGIWQVQAHGRRYLYTVREEGLDGPVTRGLVIDRGWKRGVLYLAPGPRLAAIGHALSYPLGEILFSHRITASGGLVLHASSGCRRVRRPVQRLLRRGQDDHGSALEAPLPVGKNPERRPGGSPGAPGRSPRMGNPVARHRGIRIAVRRPPPRSRLHPPRDAERLHSPRAPGCGGDAPGAFLPAHLVAAGDDDGPAHRGADRQGGAGIRFRVPRRQGRRIGSRRGARSRGGGPAAPALARLFSRSAPADPSAGAVPGICRVELKIARPVQERGSCRENSRRIRCGDSVGFQRLVTPLQRHHP